MALHRVTEALARAIIRAERPHGVRIVESRKRKNGGALEHGGTVRLPLIASDPHTVLFIYLHEVGHRRLNHFGQFLPRHIEEYEAERFAIDKMREYGIKVLKTHKRAARWNVRLQIRRDERAGIEIKSHIRRWSKRRTET